MGKFSAYFDKLCPGTVAPDLTKALPIVGAHVTRPMGGKDWNEVLLTGGAIRDQIPVSPGFAVERVATSEGETPITGNKVAVQDASCTLAPGQPQEGLEASIAWVRQKETVWFQETYQQNREALLVLAARKMPPGTNVREMVQSCHDYLTRQLEMPGLYEWVAAYAQQKENTAPAAAKPSRPADELKLIAWYQAQMNADRECLADICRRLNIPRVYDSLGGALFYLVNEPGGAEQYSQALRWVAFIYGQLQSLPAG